MWASRFFAFQVISTLNKAWFLNLEFQSKYSYKTIFKQKLIWIFKRQVQEYYKYLNIQYFRKILITRADNFITKSLLYRRAIPLCHSIFPLKLAFFVLKNKLPGQTCIIFQQVVMLFLKYILRLKIIKSAKKLRIFSAWVKRT